VCEEREARRGEQRGSAGPGSFFNFQRREQHRESSDDEEDAEGDGDITVAARRDERERNERRKRRLRREKCALESASLPSELLLRVKFAQYGR
jgi:hypothetical protein